MASIYKDFFFYLSSDLALELKVYIDHLDITDLLAALHRTAEDFLVTVRAIDGGVPLSPVYRATHTPYRRGNCVYWNEWLTIPVKIRDLTKTSQLVCGLRHASVAYELGFPRCKHIALSDAVPCHYRHRR